MGKARRAPFFEVINSPKRERPTIGLPGLGGKMPGSHPAPPPPPPPPAPPTASSAAPISAPPATPVTRSHTLEPAHTHPASPHPSAPIAPVVSGGSAPAATPLAADGPGPNATPIATNGPKVVSVSMNAVLIGITAVLVVLVGVYAIGFQRGKATADGPLTPNDVGPVSLTPPTPTIRDPIADPGWLIPGPGGGGDAAAAGSNSPGGGSATPAQPLSAAGRVVGNDPRRADTNYYELDVLPYRDAEEAVRFLVENGLPASAVPQRGVDVADAQAKNRPCIVFLLEGIPSTLYRGPEGQRVRQRIEPEVRRLGQAWRSQHRGASTFAQAYWRKHQPDR